MISPFFLFIFCWGTKTVVKGMWGGEKWEIGHEGKVKELNEEKVDRKIFKRE